MRRRPILGCVTVFILAFIVVFLLAIHTTAPPPALTTPPSPEAKAIAQQHVTQQFQYPALLPVAPAKHSAKLVQDKSTMPASPRTAKMTFAADDLNTLIRSDPMVQARMRQYDVSAIELTLEPPNVVDVHGWVNMEGGTREVTLTGNLSPTSDGKGPV